MEVTGDLGSTQFQWNSRDRSLTVMGSNEKNGKYIYAQFFYIFYGKGSKRQGMILGEDHEVKKVICRYLTTGSLRRKQVCFLAFANFNSVNAL